MATHSQFVDDTILFVESTIGEVEHFKIVKTYELVVSLKVSKQKSKIYFLTLQTEVKYDKY